MGGPLHYHFALLPWKADVDMQQLWVNANCSSKYVPPIIYSLNCNIELCKCHFHWDLNGWVLMVVEVVVVL